FISQAVKERNLIKFKDLMDRYIENLHSELRCARCSGQNDFCGRAIKLGCSVRNCAMWRHDISPRLEASPVAAVPARHARVRRFTALPIRVVRYRSRHKARPTKALAQRIGPPIASNAMV